MMNLPKVALNSAVAWIETMISKTFTPSTLRQWYQLNAGSPTQRYEKVKTNVNVNVSTSKSSIN